MQPSLASNLQSCPNFLSSGITSMNNCTYLSVFESLRGRGFIICLTNSYSSLKTPQAIMEAQALLQVGNELGEKRMRRNHRLHRRRQKKRCSAGVVHKTAQHLEGWGGCVQSSRPDQASECTRGWYNMNKSSQRATVQICKSGRSIMGMEVFLTLQPRCVPL